MADLSNSEKKMGEEKPFRYSIYNYDAINQAVDAEVGRTAAISKQASYKKYETIGRVVLVTSIVVALLILTVSFVLWLMRDKETAAQESRTNVPVLETSTETDKQPARKIVSTFDIVTLTSAEDMVTRKDFRSNESYPFKQVCYVGQASDTGHIIDWVADVKDGKTRIITEDPDLVGFVSKYCKFE